MMMNQQQPGLTPEKLQLFVAGLSGLAGEEVRKAKLLFIKNAISELKALKASLAGFGVAQGCFAIIPFFWPILWAQRVSMSSATNLQVEQIRNAIDVWRDDLGADAAKLERELEELR